MPVPLTTLRECPTTCRLISCSFLWLPHFGLRIPQLITMNFGTLIKGYAMSLQVVLFVLLIMRGRTLEPKSEAFYLDPNPKAQNSPRARCTIVFGPKILETGLLRAFGQKYVNMIQAFEMPQKANVLHTVGVRVSPVCPVLHLKAFRQLGKVLKAVAVQQKIQRGPSLQSKGRTSRNDVAAVPLFAGSERGGVLALWNHRLFLIFERKALLG